MGIENVTLFVIAGLLLNFTPGADLALIAARSSAGGIRAGAAAALGVGAGSLLHTAAAALGLSALLAGSDAAFTALRWAGAAYLVWLGFGLLLARPAAGGVASGAAPVDARRAFVQGFLTNALNPKVVLFFLAFMPQFIAPDAEHKAWALVVLGVVFSVNGTLVNVGFAWAVSSLRARTVGAGGFTRWLGRGTGALFIVLGLKLAFDGSR